MLFPRGLSHESPFVPQSQIFASDFSSFMPPPRPVDSDPLLIAQLIRDSLPPPGAGSEPPPRVDSSMLPGPPLPSATPISVLAPALREGRARARMGVLLVSLFVVACTGAFAVMAAIDGV
jgi:hypothetical protein